MAAMHIAHEKGKINMADVLTNFAKAIIPKLLPVHYVSVNTICLFLKKEAAQWL